MIASETENEIVREPATDSVPQFLPQCPLLSVDSANFL